MKIDIDDTIAAVSTPIGEGGIGIVRLSGDKAIPTAEKIFRSKSGKKLKDVSTYTTHYGHVISNGRGAASQIVDEVIVTVMRRPKTYTREDVVEINCHGGITALRSVLDLVLAKGARPARPGEFTMRAFLNGRLDLVQAEAVLDIIRAKTRLSLRVSENQLKGMLSKEIEELRGQILDVYAHIEAAIDFPEEEIDELYSREDCLVKLSGSKDKLRQLLETAEHGLILKEGILAVICGRPNVGKSSLMNAFLRQDRVIVTPVPGTTRDTIEEVVNIKGIPFNLVDTAGLGLVDKSQVTSHKSQAKSLKSQVIPHGSLRLPAGQASHPEKFREFPGLSPRNLSRIPEGKSQVEEEAEKRSYLYLKRADLVLLVLDRSEPLTLQDRTIMELASGRNTVVVLNKEDLPRRIELKEIKKCLDGKPVLNISATHATGLAELEQTLANLVWKGEVESGGETLGTSARHRQALTGAAAALERTIEGLKKNLSTEFVVIEIKEALNALGLITGEAASEEMLERIFSQFCIGK